MAGERDPVVELVDAVRQLGITRTGDPANPVRLYCSRAEISRQLLRMRAALDAIEGEENGEQTLDERMDRENAALRRMLKALLVLLREKGIDEREALEIVAKSSRAGHKTGRAAHVPDVRTNPGARIDGRGLVSRKQMVRNGYYMRRVAQAHRKQRRKREKQAEPETPGLKLG